jgi:hypothetical protein
LNLAVFIATLLLLAALLIEEPTATPSPQLLLTWFEKIMLWSLD